MRRCFGSRVGTVDCARSANKLTLTCTGNKQYGIIPVQVIYCFSSLVCQLKECPTKLPTRFSRMYIHDKQIETEAICATSLIIIRVCREGNVFSCVCLSVSYSIPWGVCYVNVTHDALDLICTGTPWLNPAPVDMGPHCTETHWPRPPLDMTWDCTVQGPPDLAPALAWLPAGDIWWPRLDTCSNLFTGGDSPGADI